MSQKKVEQYKKEKANRKQIMKKKKQIGRLRQAATVLIVCAVLAWAGFSLYQTYEAKQPRTAVEVDYAPIESYLGSLGE